METIGMADDKEKEQAFEIQIYGYVTNLRKIEKAYDKLIRALNRKGIVISGHLRLV